MDDNLIRSISQEIYRRFPEFTGVKPKIQVQKTVQSKNPGAAASYLLTFQSRANIPDQKSLPRWVRVVANEKGKIVKISTSR